MANDCTCLILEGNLFSGYNDNDQKHDAKIMIMLCIVLYINQARGIYCHRPFQLVRGLHFIERMMCASVVCVSH